MGLRGDSEAFGLSAWTGLQSGERGGERDPEGGDLRVGDSDSVVEHLDRHVKKSRGPLPAVGLEVNRAMGLVGPDLEAEALGTAQCAYSRSSRNLLVPGLICCFM